MAVVVVCCVGSNVNGLKDVSKGFDVRLRLAARRRSVEVDVGEMGMGCVVDFGEVMMTGF